MNHYVAFRVFARRVAALAALIAALVCLLIACGGVAPQVSTPPAVATTAPVPTTPPATATATATAEPSPTATFTPEPTPTTEPTPTPEFGAQNDQYQWWDGSVWQALPAGEGWSVATGENGQVVATNRQGETAYYANGEWLSKAQIETRKVVEYSNTHASEIHELPLGSMSFRATEMLQAAIHSRLPESLQALGPNPLFIVVPDPERLRGVLDSISIDIEGEKDRVSLRGQNVVFTFLSANEKIEGVQLRHTYGVNVNAQYAFGAFRAEDGTIYVVSRVGESLSRTYTYDRYSEWQLLFDAFIGSLETLAGKGNDGVRFQAKFVFEDYDKYPGSERIWMMVPCVVQLDHDGQGKYIVDWGILTPEWIPDEYEHLTGNGGSGGYGR